MVLIWLITAILEAILRRMEEWDAELSSQDNVPTQPYEKAPESYAKVEMADLVNFTLSMFRYWTEDPFAAPFRRMLTLEQYRSPEMAALFRQYLAAGPMGYVADLFRARGLSDPDRRAAAFYGPMFLLYSVYDGAENKAAVTALLEEHLDRAEKEIWGGEK